ncbi:MAG: hypothetical protein COA36_16710 [Desulfotalea sp.]|nr:MAG: hypothetical protein COA36_16710 [Desulfotalea sp.]
MNKLLLVCFVITLASCGKDKLEPTSNTQSIDPRLVGTWTLAEIEGNYQGTIYYDYPNATDQITSSGDLTETFYNTINQTTLISTGTITVINDSVIVNKLTGAVQLPERSRITKANSDTIILETTWQDIDYKYYLTH